MQESEHFPPGDSWANVPRLDPDNTRPLKRSDLPSNTKSLMAMAKCSNCWVSVGRRCRVEYTALASPGAVHTCVSGCRNRIFSLCRIRQRPRLSR